MTKRSSPLSSRGSAAKAAASAAPEAESSSPFRDLTKKLLSVPLEKVRAEEAREKKTRAAAIKKRKKAL